MLEIPDRAKRPSVAYKVATKPVLSPSNQHPEKDSTTTFLDVVDDTPTSLSSRHRSSASSATSDLSGRSRGQGSDLSPESAEVSGSEGLTTLNWLTAGVAPLVQSLDKDKDKDRTQGTGSHRRRATITTRSTTIVVFSYSSPFSASPRFNPYLFDNSDKTAQPAYFMPPSASLKTKTDATAR